MPTEALKTSELAVATSLAANAKVVVIHGSNTSIVELQYLTGNSAAIRSLSTPANSTSTTIVGGAILTDGSYLYVATANNVLKRVALSTF